MSFLNTLSSNKMENGLNGISAKGGRTPAVNWCRRKNGSVEVSDTLLTRSTMSKEISCKRRARYGASDKAQRHQVSHAQAHHHDDQTDEHCRHKQDDHRCVRPPGDIARIGEVSDHHADGDEQQQKLRQSSPVR